MLNNAINISTTQFLRTKAKHHAFLYRNHIHTFACAITSAVSDETLIAFRSVNSFEETAVVRSGSKKNKYTSNDRLKARITPFVTINFLISFDDIMFKRRLTDNGHCVVQPIRFHVPTLFRSSMAVQNDFG